MTNIKSWMIYGAYGVTGQLVVTERGYDAARLEASCQNRYNAGLEQISLKQAEDAIALISAMPIIAA